MKTMCKSSITPYAWKRGKFQTFLVLLAFLLVPAFAAQPLGAQETVTNQPFATFADGVLTFDYGEKPATGQVYDVTEYVDIQYGSMTKPAWYSINSQVTKVVFKPSFAQAHPTCLSFWFDGCKNLTDIEGMEYLNTSKTNHFYAMFQDCEKLESIDVTHFDTSSAIVFCYMFNRCKSLKQIDVTGFDTRKVGNFAYMFAECESLTELDLTNFDLLTKRGNWQMSAMNSFFSGCKNLRAVYVSTLFDFTNVPANSAWNLFDGCVSLEGAVKYAPAMGEGQNTDRRDLANYTTGLLQKNVGNQGTHTVGAAGNPLKIISLNLLDKETLVLTDGSVKLARQATYDRDINSKWATVCLPFAIDVADEANTCWFYPMTEVQLDRHRIPVQRMTDGIVEAGVPMFAKRKSASQTTLHIEGVKSDKGVSLVTKPVNKNVGDRLVGTLCPVTFTAQPMESTVKEAVNVTDNLSNTYFISQDKFRPVQGYLDNGAKGVLVYAYRAYIVTDQATPSATSAPLSIDDSNTTGLEVPTVGDELSTPTEYYDLQGRRLDSLQPGVTLVKKGNKVIKVVKK